MNRTPELQNSSIDPILALLNKQQNEENKADMPLQMRPNRSPNQNRVVMTRAQREGSPIIGGGKMPDSSAHGGAFPTVGDPYGMNKNNQRPRPTLANGGQAQVQQQPKRGFAGFKAPPTTELID